MTLKKQVLAARALPPTPPFIHHAEAAVALLGHCTSLQSLRIEAAQRGAAALAAEHAALLAPLTRLTLLSLSLSKGSLPAARSAATALAALTTLRALSVASLSANHRLSLAPPQLVGMAESWPCLARLTLSSLCAPDGLACLSVLSGLTALSLRAAVGQGRALQGLGVGLAGLHSLQRLALDLRASMRPELLAEIADAVGAAGRRLSHLSLSLRGAALGARGAVELARLGASLTSLQLLGVPPAVLGPPAAAADALRALQRLRSLAVCVQEAGAASIVGPDSARAFGNWLAAGAEALPELLELRLWAGGFAACRTVEREVFTAVTVAHPCCCVRVLQEPERPML